MMPVFNLNYSMADNLLLFKGKYVFVTLTSGSTFKGYVKDVNNGMLHLEKISSHNYFDALILVNDIAAFEAQMRGL